MGLFMPPFLPAIAPHRQPTFLRPICRTCLHDRPLLPFLPYRSFHPSRRKLADEFPDHYATLDLHASASPAEIKKQFYALSKKYHPDVNHDPSASERFVKISEAYHILGSAGKKERYDRDFARAHRAAGGGHTPHGSHSSHSARTHAGGRPASGLSRRRGTFRGPPPSFYAQGGYGTTGAKRSTAQAEADAQGWAQQQAGGLGSKPNYTGTGGFSPGSDAEFNPDPSMPYFDKESHKRTQEGLGARREQFASSRRWEDPLRGTPYTLPGSMMMNFVVMSCIVAGITIVGTIGSQIFVGGGGGSGQPAGGGIRRKRDDG